MDRRVSVVIGDENPRTRSGLKAILEAFSSIEIVGEAAGGRETLESVEQKRPDVIVLDLKLPIRKSLETIRKLREQWPLVRIIVLSQMYQGYQAQAVQAGVDAYLVKGTPTSELVRSILG
jgi:DNA-binding NarL/FixJ family response regulator